MWELKIIFDNEETTIIRGEESDIPLTSAVRYYDLFVKDAGGKAFYRQDIGNSPVLLTDKILQLVHM